MLEDKYLQSTKDEFLVENGFLPSENYLKGN